MRPKRRPRRRISARISRRGTFFAGDGFAGEAEIKIAEFAGHHNVAADCHVVEIVLRETLQDIGQAGARAAAAIGEGAGFVDGDALAVEQAVEDAFRQQGVVQQFGLGDGVGQDAGGAPGFLLLAEARQPFSVLPAARYTRQASCSLVSK